MSTDEVIKHLRDEYRETRVRREQVADEIREKHRRAEEREIADAQFRTDLALAERIRDAVEAGVPVSRIRMEVLRTGDWKRWTYWRDLPDFF